MGKRWRRQGNGKHEGRRNNLIFELSHAMISGLYEVVWGGKAGMRREGEGWMRIGKGEWEGR